MMMGKHSQVPLTILLVVVCLPALPVQAQYSGGSGTADDPYQIATAADLIALGETPADYNKHFILTADIDLDPNLPGRKVFDKAVIAPDISPGQWGFQGTSFTGVFDGDGHTISHLTIVGKDYLGLFGILGPVDQRQPTPQTEEPIPAVRNVRVEDVDITGSGSDIGGLVGANEWMIVSRSYSTGRVRGHGAVGGLVGYNQHRVINCHSTATVTGESWVGGLVGDNNGLVTWCYSMSTVSGDSDVGGLVGSHRGTITQSYSTGAVTGKDAVGGLVGCSGVVGRRTQPGDIDRSYSTANAQGETFVGGLLGRNIDGAVSQCYSTGMVSGSAGVGGLVGGGWSLDVTSSFWDIETSGLPVSHGGEGKTTAQMQAAGTFLDAGWDFAGEASNGLHETWQMPAEGGYPILTVLNGYTPPTLQGQGTLQEPYLISNARELGAMIHYSLYAHYRLTTSIDLSGIRWTREVTPHFAGTFDGGGHAIAHLTMTGPDSLGLFRGLDAAGEVKDLGIVDANMVSSRWDVGGLMGYNWGFVTRCYTTGAVSGPSGIGGLVGRNGGAVDCCYSTAAVSGITSVGGLVGRNQGAVTRCYSVGIVSAQLLDVGGLVGYNYGNVTECFWDTDTSGQSASAGGIGKTTAEMQMAGTFLDAGWDFVGETANGTDDIWWILEGRDYPRLWWEAPAVDD